MVTACRLRSALALGLVLLAGCGGSSGSGASAKPNGEGSKDPQQILSDTAAALANVKSLHIAGTQTDKDGTASITGDIALPGRLHISLAIGSKKVEFIVVPGAAYLKANGAFWSSVGANGAALASKLADKWVKTSTDQIPEVAQFEAVTQPATIGHCFLGPHFGTVTKAGTDSVEGHPVVVLTDQGDKPGSQPQRIFITTDGPPLPIRLTQTGAAKPGGTLDATCHETKGNSTTSAGEFRFSDYDKPVTINPPSDALDLSQPGGGQSS